MTSFIYTLWGHGRELSVGQMSLRAVVVFFVCLVLIRISGRRSFSFKTPLDNVIAIILGATISRTIVGASPFLPTVAASLCIVLLHRILAMARLRFHNKKYLNGRLLLLYASDHFIESNLEKAMVSPDEIQSVIRKDLHQEDLNNIEKIYMEKNGQISFILAKQAP